MVNDTKYHPLVHWRLEFHQTLGFAGDLDYFSHWQIDHDRGIYWAYHGISSILSGPPCINEMSSQVLLGQCDLACGFHRSRKCLVAGSLPWYGWATGGYLDIVADSSGLQVPCDRDGDSTAIKVNKEERKWIQKIECIRQLSNTICIQM
jgi:hypothetical protein